MVQGLPTAPFAGIVLSTEARASSLLSSHDLLPISPFVHRLQGTMERALLGQGLRHGSHEASDRQLLACW